MKTISYKILILLLLSLSKSGVAQEIITIESTITGSQEQPKMLVIIPWQKPQDADTRADNTEAINAANQPFLQLIERQSFNDKNAWLKQLNTPQR